MRALCRSWFVVVAALGMVGLAACEQEVASPGCEGGSCPKDEEPVPARLYVDPPFGVGFDCVAVGCDDVRVFRLENRGDGEAVVTLVRLSVDSSTELSVAMGAPEGEQAPSFPTVEQPLSLGKGDSVEVHVRYQPDDADTDQGELWIDWYDGKTAYEDAVVQRVEMPILTRVLGSPEAEQGATDLNFGFVALGESRTLYIEVTNAAEGSAVLELQPPQLAPGSDYEFSLGTDGAPIYVNPGETTQIPVTFAPTATDWFQGLVYIPTNDGARPQLAVTLRGTAIRDPFLSVEEPADWLVDFGNVRVGNTGTRQVVLRNLGGQPLQVTASLPDGAGLGFTTPIPLDVPLPAIPPLGYVRFDVSSAPAVGGETWGEMRFATNDPTLPEDWVDLYVYGVFPDAAIDAPNLDFGTIVQSWTSPAQTVRISNQGTGDLTISGIEWEVGSSSQVRLADVPSLPRKIGPGDPPLELSVYVEAQTLGPANATLLLHTDSVNEPVRRVSAVANVVSCGEGCPVANGTPSCSSGRCEVDTCFAGFHDADTSWSTGCECGEDSTPQGTRDVGDFCSSGANVGPLTDNCGSGNSGWVNRTGTLHTTDDEDLYYFTADDGSSAFCDTFGDSFRVQVQFVSAPPGVEFCVRDTSAGGGCGGENQRQCGLTSYSNGGSYGSDDDSDVTVWVRRTPGYPPMCGNYTIRFRAKD